MSKRDSMPDDIADVALACGYNWPDDEAAQVKVLIGIARTVKYWRTRNDEAVKGIVRERIYTHLRARNAALARRLRNVRRAAMEYRQRQNFDQFVWRMCDGAERIEP